MSKYSLGYQEFKNEIEDLENIGEGYRWDRFKHHMGRIRDTASRVKDHIARHKGKYILGAAAALSGAGLAAIPIGLLAGHLHDRHPN